MGSKHEVNRVKRLTAHGVSIEVPPGWEGRVSRRGGPLPGAAIISVGSFPISAREGGTPLTPPREMQREDVLLVLSETLPNQKLPPERPRIEAVGRRGSVDRYFVASGRAFLLHATFGSRRPPARMIGHANDVLASLKIEARERPLRPAPDPAPDRALRAPRLFSTPIRVVTQCRLAQTRSSFPILCPLRLPRPFIGWPRDDLPAIAATKLPAPNASWKSHSDPRYRRRSFGGLSIGYGAPWEPDSGPDWRLHLWRNRPCCFLHFEVFRRAAGRAQIPAGARPATLGGRQGLLKEATSYGLASRENDYLYFANHTRFLWRERGVPYVATLHRFGTRRETRALLGRLIRELRMTTDLA